MHYSKSFQVIWADVDANRHMRHTAYNDYAAQLRVNFFSDHGFSFEKFGQLQIGPILFREETVFLKEVGLSETITIDILLAASRKNGSRWKIVHNVFKGNGEKAATITVEGAWMDLTKRKLTEPPQEVLSMIDIMPKTENYLQLEDKKS